MSVFYNPTEKGLFRVKKSFKDFVFPVCGLVDNGTNLPNGYVWM